MTRDKFMHKNAMDVFIEVLGVEGESHLVRWWNLGYVGKPWEMDLEVVTIKKEDEHNWRELTSADFLIPRK